MGAWEEGEWVAYVMNGSANGGRRRGDGKSGGERERRARLNGRHRG